MHTQVLSPGVQREGSGADHSEIKNGRSYTSTIPYTFMVFTVTGLLLLIKLCGKHLAEDVKCYTSEKVNFTDKFQTCVVASDCNRDSIGLNVNKSDPLIHLPVRTEQYGVLSISPA
jgi:uncharacterized Fe-S cluster protein YjdI